MNFFLLLIFIIFQGGQKNVTDNTEFENIVNKQFVLQQDVFLADSDGVVSYSINIPGQGSHIPLTVEDFKKYPTNWWESENYIKRYREPWGNAYHIKNITIIKKNTKIYVTKVINKVSFEFDHLYLIGFIEDGEHNNIPINVTYLFKSHSFDNPRWFSVEDNMLKEAP